MNTSIIPHPDSSVTTDNPQNHATPFIYIRIPLEVAHDHHKQASEKHPEGESLPDGAKLMLGEVMGLQARYGHCTATDAHFMNRLGKSRATIQQYIAILARRGYVLVTGDGHNRELRVAERFLGVKDVPYRPDNQTVELRYRPEIQTIGDTQCPENQTVDSSNHLENQTHKTQKNPKNQESEKEEQTPESCRHDSHIAQSDEDQVDAACRMLDDAESRHYYSALWRQCSEQARTDAWDTAMTATRKCQSKGELGKTPIAYFRSVMQAALSVDNQHRRHPAVAKSEQRSAQTAPNEAPMPQSYSVFVPPVKPAPTTTASQNAEAMLNEIVMTIPEDMRADVMARAEAQFKAEHPVHWARGSSRSAYQRLMRMAVQSILAK